MSIMKAKIAHFKLTREPLNWAQAKERLERWQWIELDRINKLQKSDNAANELAQLNYEMDLFLNMIDYIYQEN